MSNTSRHPSDEEILQLIDLELSGSRAELIKKHLASCSACQDRQALIASRSRALDEFYDSEEIVPNVRMAGSRVRLQRKLGEYRRNSSQRRVQMPLFQARLPIAALTMLVVIGLTFYLVNRVWQSRSAPLSSRQKVQMPNPSLTPGAVRPVTLSEICPVRDDDLDPKVSLSTEMAVLKEYGLPSDTSGAERYQIDYLVNPQLGGTNDIKNLWPQPYANGAWNAQAKDMLEHHLHQMVCNRTVNLVVVQQELEADWIAAYKKYLGRNRS